MRLCDAAVLPLSCCGQGHAPLWGFRRHLPDDEGVNRAFASTCRTMRALVLLRLLCECLSWVSRHEMLARALRATVLMQGFLCLRVLCLSYKL